MGRDGFTEGVHGGAHPSSPSQVGCRGGAIFMIKQKNMRHKVFEYHV